MPLTTGAGFRILAGQTDTHKPHLVQAGKKAGSGKAPGGRNNVESCLDLTIFPARAVTSCQAKLNNPRLLNPNVHLSFTN